MAALEIFTNDATTTVTTGGTTAPAGGTVETWTVASSSSFPPASSTGVGTSFKVADPNLVSEKILVTNVSGTTWTVTRGADGTTPVAHTAGFTIRQVATSSTMAKVLDWILPTSPIFGADPTGVNDSTAAINNALLAAVPGQDVYLPAGTYLTSTPVILGQNTPTLVQGVMLRGAMPAGPDMGFAVNDAYGSVIKGSAGWTRGSIAATNNPGIIYVNGDSTTIRRAALQDIWVDMSATPSGTHGVSVWGGVFHSMIRNIGVLGQAGSAAASGAGCGMILAKDGSGNRWDGGIVSDIILQNCVGNGLQWYGQDTQISNVHAQAYQASTGSLSGIYIVNGNNTRWTNCRSDQSGDSGFLIDSNPGGAPNTPGSTISLVNCGTENNQNYGCKIINSSGSGTAQPRTPVNITGCSFDFDGQQGGVNPVSGAGIAVQGVNVVSISNTNVTNGGNQGSGNAHLYPEYGLVCLTPGAAQRVEWRGGIANTNSGPVLDSSGSNPIVDIGAVTGSAWINTSTVVPFKLNLQDSRGEFGDGSDGAVNFDGTSTVLGLVPSAGAYTLTRDIFCTSIQVGGGATATTILPSGWRIFCTGTVTIAANGTISANGASASGTNNGTNGPAGPVAALGGGRPGGNGTTTNGNAGTASTGVGTGSSGGGGNGLQPPSTTTTGAASSAAPSSGVGWLRTPFSVLATALFNTSAVNRIDGGSGGASGGGDGTNKGGGGGAGGGVIAIFAQLIVNNGTISAIGGNGGSPTTVVANGGCGGGGGGAGGLILLYTILAITGSGSRTVAGGSGGTAVTNGTGTAANGTAGSAGTSLNIVLA